MPFYAFKCGECENQFDCRLKMAERDDPQKCPQCEAVGAQRLVTGCNFNLPGDGWASKNGRIQKQMQKKNRRLGTKKTEMLGDGSTPGGKLVPNVGGERVETWGEAKKLAASQGKETSGYDKMAASEKSAPKKPIAP